MKLGKTSLAAMAAVVMASGITTADAKNNFRTGAYAGVEGGWLYEWHHYRQLSTIVPNPFNSPTLSQKKKKNSNSGFPGIFAGYRHFFNDRFSCYFAGLEIAAYWNFSESHANFIVPVPGVTALPINISTHQSLHGRYNVLPSITFGRVFRDRWSLYGKIGFDGGLYKYRMKEVSPTGVILNETHKHKRFNHLFLGVGVEMAFNCWLSGRLDYNYSFNFGHRTARMKPTALLGVFAYKTHLKVEASALKVGLLAKF